MLALTTAAYTESPKRLEEVVRCWANRNVVGVVLHVGQEMPVKPPLISTLRYFREIGKATKIQDFTVVSIREFFSATGVTSCCVLDTHGDIVTLVDELDNDAIEKALTIATAR